MSAFDPHALDVVAFADAAASLSGTLALQACERLRSSLRAGATDAAVAWQVRGGWQEAGALGRQPGLRLLVDAVLPMVCQRCLGALQVPVALDRHFVFAPDEQTAARWDQELDDDVLALARRFDLLALIEDELILALPLIPRHTDCPDRPEFTTKTPDFDAAEAKRENPFAVLADYKRKGKG